MYPYYLCLSFTPLLPKPLAPLSISIFLKIKNKRGFVLLIVFVTWHISFFAQMTHLSLSLLLNLTLSFIGEFNDGSYVECKILMEQKKKLRINQKWHWEIKLRLVVSESCKLANNFISTQAF